MKTYIVLITLLVVIATAVFCDAQQSKSDQFEMPVVKSPSTPAPAKPVPQPKKPIIYVLSMPNCGPCARLKGEILGGSKRAGWLLANVRVLFIRVDGFPTVMSTNGSQFEWPAEAWKPGPEGSPLKALTNKLGYKDGKVGIKDLEKMNADLILSEFSGVSEDVQCIPPAGHEITEPIPVQGDFLEDDNELLQVNQNSEEMPRSALVDLPRVIPGSPVFERKWKFLIDGETWLFNGFKGRDANVQTVMLTIPGVVKNTGRAARH